MREVYLDHNATTPVHPEAKDAMLPYLDRAFGNPSSSHWAGREAREAVERARAQVADLISADPSEIVFTSGGSEGDNMAVRGAVMEHGRGSHVIISSVEHPAVFGTCRLLEKGGLRVTYLPVGESGRVEVKDVQKAMGKRTVLISVMLANNETGVMNPVGEIVRIARERGILMHTDAVQAVGKAPIDVRALGVDILTASGHKFNAPKGVGFQYVREGLRLPPIISGGHHERGLRAGTENVPGIAALGMACAVAKRDMAEKVRAVGALRDRLERGILEKVPGTVVNGDRSHRVYNTTNISFRGIEGDALMALLDREGIAVSTGSACAAGSTEPSRVLTAMGLDVVRSRGAVRFSLGLGTAEEDIDRCLKIVPAIANRLLEMSPLYEGPAKCP
jgi:cysteine desulfurase